MPTTLMLVVALAGGNWDCQQKDGLWDCQPEVQPPVNASALPGKPPPETPPAETSRTRVDRSPPVPESGAARGGPITGASPAPTAKVVEKTPAQSAAYIVQIGAYRQKSEAEAAARELGYESLAIMPTRRGNESWYVLLLGAFPGLEQARAAGDAYVKAHPQGSYWVRTDSQLKEVLQPDS